MPAVFVVISLNIVIALFGFFVAWRLWQLKGSLGGVADALSRWEQNARHRLEPNATPAAILRGQRSTASLRHHYACLQLQVYRVRQIMMLLSLVPMSARWARRLNRRKR